MIQLKIHVSSTVVIAWKFANPDPKTGEQELHASVSTRKPPSNAYIVTKTKRDCYLTLNTQQLIINPGQSRWSNNVYGCNKLES